MVKSLRAGGLAGSMSVTKGTAGSTAAPQSPILATFGHLSCHGAQLLGVLIAPRSVLADHNATRGPRGRQPWALAGGTGAGDLAVDETGRVYVGATAAGAIHMRTVRGAHASYRAYY
jgi:hypothetical protein